MGFLLDNFESMGCFGNRLAALRFHRCMTHSAGGIDLSHCQLRLVRSQEIAKKCSRAAARAAATAASN